MIPVVPAPLNSGTYAATGASSRTRPRSSSTISAVVVATTLVSDARSYSVPSGSTGALDADQVRWP